MYRCIRGEIKMELTEKTVKQNVIYDGKIIRVRVDDATLPNGKPCKREIVDHPGGACVLYVKENKVLLVKQFRYAYGEAIYEIPAGKLNEGEDPMVSAIRELEEEAGLKAKSVKHLFTFYPTPGYTNEKIYVYYAEEVTEGRVHLDEGAFLNSEYLPLSEVVEMIEKGEIRDAKTIIAVQWYLLHR